MLKKSSLFVCLLLVAASLVSCDSNGTFDEYKSLPKIWHQDSVVTFKFNQKDTLGFYNMFVNLRANKDYPYSNMFLIIALEKPDQTTTVDTLEYAMARPDGSMLGKGFSDVKESILFYKEAQQFNKAGDYKVSIRHANRDAGSIEGNVHLKGIQNVGLRIEKIEK